MLEYSILDSQKGLYISNGVDVVDICSGRIGAIKPNPKHSIPHV